MERGSLVEGVRKREQKVGWDLADVYAGRLSNCWWTWARVASEEFVHYMDGPAFLKRKLA
jgi:hypothetical protein